MVTYNINKQQKASKCLFIHLNTFWVNNFCTANVKILLPSCHN